MPHQRPNALLPGESLLPGEELVSNNGRFRVFFEPAGYVALWGYRVGHGRYPMWSSGVVRDRDVTFPGVQFYFPARGDATLHAANGVKMIVAHPNYSNVPNHELVIQDDGGFVLYGNANGNIIAQWGSNTHQYGAYPSYVEPNASTWTVVSGRIALGTDTDTELHNTDTVPIAVVDSSTVVRLDPNAKVPAAEVGRVDLILHEFPSMTDSAGGQNWCKSTIRSSSDALPRAQPGRKLTIGLNRFSLSLTSPREGLQEGAVRAVTIAELRDWPAAPDEGKVPK